MLLALGLQVAGKAGRRVSLVTFEVYERECSEHWESFLTTFIRHQLTRS